jgi:hypothetical protein
MTDRSDEIAKGGVARRRLIDGIDVEEGSSGSPHHRDTGFRH